MFRLLLLIVSFIGSQSVLANAIIHPSLGLTLAETATNPTRTLLVLSDKNQYISAIDVAQATGAMGGIVETYNALGYERLAALTRAPQNPRTYSYAELQSPAGRGTFHLGLGFNYPEHADEMTVERQPFLFLKTTEATRSTAIAYHDERLLDYEIELCARPLQDITYLSDVDEAVLGLFLCGDFTDRATLLRKMNIDNIHSGRGFNAAKSMKGYYPTGPYMVIPRNIDTFTQSVRLSLYRNSALKQSTLASETIWDIKQLCRAWLLAAQHVRPTHAAGYPDWLLQGRITTDMTILTGTPAGVIMQPPSMGFKVVSGIHYVFSGKFLETSVQEHTIERYIRHLLAEKTFLQRHEEIRLQADYLGEIKVTVN